MSPTYLRHDLHDGYIHHWLVMDPHAIPGDLAGAGPAPSDPDPVLGSSPAEPSSPDDGVVLPGGELGRWRYVSCLEDHAVGDARFVHLPEAAGDGDILCAWAYAELDVPSADDVMLVVTPLGGGWSAHSATLDLWVNRRPVDLQPTGGGRGLLYSVPLAQGTATLLVRITMPPDGVAATPLALRVVRSGPDKTLLPADDVVVCLPTSIERVERRNLLERVFSAAYLDRYVFAREDELIVRWPTKEDGVHGFDESASLTARLRSLQQLPGCTHPRSSARSGGRIYAEANRVGEAGSYARLGRAYLHPSGAFEVTLMPRAEEYYQGGMRITREIPLWGLDNCRVTESPEGAFVERRKEALLHVARRELGVYSEMAKMAIGLWPYVDAAVISEAIASLATERGDPHGDLLGLLHIEDRYAANPGFPAAAFATLEASTLQMDFDAATADDLSLESHELLVATAELLAGQRFPERIFASSGEPGAWHRARGGQRALSWMQRCAQRGLREWNSDLVMEEAMLALSCLIDFAEAELVWQMATALMDKLLYQLALASFKGVFGVSRGRTATTGLFGGYLQATSGIAKVMFGMGVVNDGARATTSVACLREYELPVMLQTIAADLPSEGIWSRERHGATSDFDGVHVVAYKTPDFMLSAAQDERPGEPGRHEHIWQATLGPGATVFVNHPACSSLDVAWQPNFWLGNGVLPRVVQWHDALIALYKLPQEDWMGFTHAYFPLHAFDEVVMRDGWAFARRGEGYLALWASEAMSLVRAGHSAYRELRAYGLHHAWICQMGRAALDGDFAAFQERVLALPRSVEDLAVRWTTLRGDALELAWEGPFLKNGEPLPLRVEAHLESPYCVADLPVSVMDIRYHDVVMRLKFVAD